jgi:Ni/Fe-hydrogenase 1 B-type cytochrome subunit
MKPIELHPVYVWQWPVRLIHWTMVLTLPALAFTGFYISAPFISGKFTMAWMRYVHLGAAYAFSTAVLARLVWMFLGNQYARWDQIVPATRERFRGIFRQAKFYLWPVGEPPEWTGHNPLAGMSYIAWYGLALLIMASGLALHGIDAAVGSPFRWLASLAALFGGAQLTRVIHHALMWLSFLFVAIHVYIVIFIARTEKNAIVDSMLVGWKLVPHRKAKHG